MSTMVDSMPSCLSYNVKLDRKLYYGNDLVTGTLEIDANQPVVLPVVRMAVFCHFIMIESFQFKRIARHPMYSSTAIIAREFYVAEGITSLPFSFRLPCDAPVSVKLPFCSVQWEVKLLGTSGIVHNTLSSCRFSTAVLYYSIGSSPKAQCEFLSKRNNAKLRAEVSLSRDVYSDGDAVDVQLSVHMREKSPSIKSIRACITQRAQVVGAEPPDGWKKLNTQIDESYLLPKSLKYKWAPVKAGGKAFSHTFGLVAQVPANMSTNSRLAIQKRGSNKIVLPPSTYLGGTKYEPGLMVSYTVDVKIKFHGYASVEWSVPFNLQAATTKLDVVGFEAPLPTLDDYKIFPLALELPPEYDEHVLGSTHSYTSLRLDSADSVFSSINTCISSKGTKSKRGMYGLDTLSCRSNQLLTMAKSIVLANGECSDTSSLNSHCQDQCGDYNEAENKNCSTEWKHMVQHV
eukprot:CFRG4487T1